MKPATEQKKANGVKCLGFGEPKGAGKSTFYLTAPLPILDLQFDLGSVTIPPGVDANQVFVQDYPDDTIVDLSTAAVKRRRENGDKVAKDLVALLESFKNGTDIVKLSDGTSCPKPKSLLLDGGERLDQILIDLICAINGITDPSLMPNKSGAGVNSLAFYNDRLGRLRKLFTMIISLPINVNMTTWADIQFKKDAGGNVISKTLEPALGGKLNIVGPGMFDSCIFHYHDAGKYLVRTKPSPEIGRLGIRDDYRKDITIIDVTIDPDGKKPLPYDRVFGGVGLTAGK